MPEATQNRNNIDAAKSWLVRNTLTVLVGVLALLVVFLTSRSNGLLLEPMETQNVVRLLLIGTFFILLVWGHHDTYTLFQVTNSVLVPITVVLILGYIWFDAWGADELSREDRVIEDFSFLFPIAGSACLALVASLMVRRRAFRTGLLAGLGAITFFVIAMEEISWFQRVLDLETAEFFANLNDQGEANFHNVYTHESEDIYYLGGFLLLVMLPYFREHLGRFLDRIGWTSARVLLPPLWLIPPFVLAGAFVSQGFVSRAANVTFVLGSIVILIALIQKHTKAREWGRAAQSVVSLVIMVTAIVMLLGIDFTSQGVRPWIGKEYQEFYIAWGIFAYGVSVIFQMLEHDRAEVQAEIARESS